MSSHPFVVVLDTFILSVYLSLAKYANKGFLTKWSKSYGFEFVCNSIEDLDKVGANI